MARRQKGAGSIYQRCSPERGCPAMVETVDARTAKVTKTRPVHKCRGPWVGSIELPSPDGTRRRKVVVRAKREDVVREQRENRSTLEKSGDLPTSSLTLSAWIDIWWKRYALPRLKVSVRDGYKSKINQYIRPAIGKVKLDKLGPEHVHRLRDYIIETKGLSSTTALNAHRVLSTILSDAVTDGKTPRNVCLIVDKPSAEVKQPNWLASPDVRHLLEFCDPEDGTVPQELAMWAVAFFSGARQGERLGMSRQFIKVDRELVDGRYVYSGRITIAWSLKRLSFDHGCVDDEGEPTCGRRKGGYCPKRRLDVPPGQEVRPLSGGLFLMRPKTRKSWRSFPMVGILAEIMWHYLANTEPGVEGLIFTRPDGRPIDPSADNKAWRDVLERSGTRRVKGHSARDSCNTILSELGVPVEVRREILGQASNAVNEEIYTHASDARVDAAMQLIDAELDWRRRALPAAHSET